MAFDSTNLVTVGDDTLKSNYDQLLDNSTYLLNDVLKIASDTDIRVGASAAVEVNDFDLYGDSDYKSGSGVTMEAGSTFRLDNGAIQRSSSGSISIIPDSGSITGGQNGISISDTGNFDIYARNTSEGTQMYEWSGSVYNITHFFRGNRYNQYHTGGSNLFVDSDPDNDRFTIAGDGTEHELFYDTSLSLFRITDDVSTNADIALSFDCDDRIFGFFWQRPVRFSKPVIRSNEVR